MQIFYWRLQMTNITRADIEKLIEPYRDGIIPYGIMKHPHVIKHLLIQIDALREKFGDLINEASEWTVADYNIDMRNASLNTATQALAQTEHLAKR